MERYCVSWGKKEVRLIKTKRNRLKLVSKCVICGKKKSRFIENQKAIGLLRKLMIRTPLSNIL